MNTGKTALASAILLLVMITTMPFRTEGILKTSDKVSFTDKELVYDLRAGYADELHFLVIENETERVETLQAGGGTDLLGETVKILESELYGSLLEDPAIEMNTTQRDGLGCLSINCARYPTNCTELRQALAFALDKRALPEEIWYNYSVPLDSPVLPAHGDWSLENQPWAEENNYYGADPARGNQILDAHGWNDTDGDGWREDPAGNPVEIELVGQGNLMYKIVEKVNESFASIGIKADVKMIWNIGTRLLQGNFMIAGHGREYNLEGLNGPAVLRNFQTGDPLNFCHWSNATYDALVDTALTSFNITEAKQACLDAQKILWHEVPLVILYHNLLIAFYRTDRWDGWVNENLGYQLDGTCTGGTCGDWTFLKVHLKPGFGKEAGEQYTNWQQGGHFNVSIPGPPGPVYTMNPLMIGLLYGDSQAIRILNLVYDTLCRRHPYTGEFCPWLAWNWELEELDDTDPDFTAGHPRARPGDRLKITYYLHGDVSFHDGYPLTAEDVVYSFELVNYSRSIHKDLWQSNQSLAINSVTHVEAFNETTVEFYCRTASSLNLDEINSIPVLPRHIWVNVEDPLTWDNPCPIGSGPYRWKNRPTDDHLILKRNDDFIYNPRNYEWPPDQNGSGTTTMTTTTSGTGTGPSTTPVPGFVLVTVLATAATAVLARKKRTR